MAWLFAHVPSTKDGCNVMAPEYKCMLLVIESMEDPDGRIIGYTASVCGKTFKTWMDKAQHQIDEHNER